MPKYGLVIDYEYCTGCHVCEIVCKKEHNRPKDEWGIIVKEVEPDVTRCNQYYVPFPTDKCNLCGKRISKGLKPACVSHCWAQVMKFGTIEELSEYMKKKAKTVLWVAH